MKKLRSIVCIMLVMLMVLPLFPVFADETEYTVIKEGLVAHYDAINNTGSGHSNDATTWTDLMGGEAITLEKTANNYFTDTAYHLSGSQFYFPGALLDLVNGNEFTVEMKIGDIAKTGSSFSTMINSSGNDNFALFLRTSGDYIEFKSSSNGRPKVSGGKEYVKDSTLAITFSKSAKTCVMYIDGIEIGSASVSTTVGAQGKLFFGHSESTRKHTADYEAFRFYNRALSGEEVANNAKADGNYDFSYVPPREFANVAQSKTNIAGGIALVEYIDTVDKIEGLFTRECKPAVAILYINSALCLTDAMGDQLSTYDLQALEAASDNTIIPAFYVRDEATVNSLCAALEEIKYEDCYIISDNADLIKLARNTYGIARGVLDLSAKYSGQTVLSDENITEIRKTVNSSLSKVVVLPESVATQAEITKLNNYGVTSWIKANEKLESKKDALYLLLSAAYGIISDNTALLVDVATNTLVSNTVTRMPLVIGHRGTAAANSNAPENTVEGALVAYANGANAIEVDIYITADGTLVINHNSTTTNMKRIDNGKSVSMGIESSKLKVLQQLYYAGYYTDENGAIKIDADGSHAGTDSEYKGYQIPTVEELFEAFKDKEDVTLVIEFKSYKKTVVPALKELIEKYNMYDKCTVICYETYAQHGEMIKNYPEMTVGLLYNTISQNAKKPAQALVDPIKKVQEHNTTLNPNYSGFSSVYIREATYRGVSVLPYTINNTSDIYNGLLYGYSGITTDHAHVMGSVAKQLIVTAPEKANAQEVLTVKVDEKNYKREIAASQNAVLTVLEGAELIEKIEGLNITFKDGASGEVCLLVSAKQELAATKSFMLYAQPVTVQVESDAPVVDPPSESESTDNSENSAPAVSPTPSDDGELSSVVNSPSSDKNDQSKPDNDTPDNDKKDGGMVIAIIGGVVAAAVVVAVIIIVVLKKKK
ncbi:MAG: hypothetical protein IJX08_02445 [Clostridia bacterium]|nr:hypothetical protein [Clostridia bacterium]